MNTFFYCMNILQFYPFFSHWTFGLFLLGGKGVTVNTVPELSYVFPVHKREVFLEYLPRERVAGSRCVYFQLYFIIQSYFPAVCNSL